LAIAKQMVDLMQGSIYFESEPTVKPGTSCIVELPLPICDDDQLLLPPMDRQNDDAAAVALSNANDNTMNDPGSNQQHQDFLSSTAPLVEPLSILVVDDIKMNRALLKKRIQKCIAPNCTVQEAANGEQALAICFGNDTDDGISSPPPAFDVIIVDQFMEEAGGILVGTDVVIAMRRSKLDNVVIIGNSGNDLDDKFLAAGADLFWKKPLPSNADIIRQLRLALEHRRVPCYDAAPRESPNYCDQEIIDV
jgi:CheY-like chemotaxis protein